MVSSPFGGVDSFDRALWEVVCEALQMDFSDGRVLDVGCGRALVASPLEQRGAKYFGLDLLSSFESRPPSRFCLGEAGALPFDDGAFDRVLCFDAFEHFADPAQAAKEFSRVLQPGGFIFLSIPNYFNVAGIVKWFAETFGRYEKNSWAPFGGWTAQAKEHFVTPGKVKRWFRGAGLKRGRCIGLDREVVSGLFPWQELPSLPEAIRFRLQLHGQTVKRFLARNLPTASLHLFWKFER